MNSQRHTFGFVGNALAKLGCAFRGERSGLRARGAAAQAPAMFESLESRRMMSATPAVLPAPQLTPPTTIAWSDPRPNNDDR